MTSTPRYISDIIDELGITKPTWKIYLLVGLCMVCNGFVYMVVAYTMPQLANEWSLTKVQTGSLASWTLLGLMIGGAIAGVVSDRIGRKKTLILSCVAYALFSLPIYLAPNFTTFAVLRVLSGIGLGACIPVAATINSEFAPSKYRGVFVASTFAWLITGWVFAGIISMVVVPTLGWRFCYLLGGLPMAYTVILALFLPESLHWLVAKGRQRDAIPTINAMERAARGHAAAWTPQSLIAPPPPAKIGIGALFYHDYRLATVGLWVIYFMGCIMIYGITAWMPSLLHQKGLSLTKSYGFSVLQNLVSIAGSACTGISADRIGRRKNVILGYGMAAIAVIFLGTAERQVAVLCACVFVGFATNFALSGVQPLLVETYRTEFRNTGVALTNAFGRIGGFIGPLMVGYVQQLGGGYKTSVLSFIVPALLAIIAVACCIKRETLGESLDAAPAKTS